MNEKGSIHIETIIKLAIVVMVFLAIIILIANTLKPGGETLRCSTAFRTQCNKFLTAGGCLDESTLLPVTDGYINESVAECAIGKTDDGNVTVACCNMDSE